MNDIIKAVTPDGCAGYDQYDQFWVYQPDARNPEIRVGSIYKDLRGQKCMLCDQKWKTEARDLADQYYNRDAEIHVHKSCYVRHLSFLERQKLMDTLVRSELRDKVKAIDDIPNQYGGAWNTPWYEITLNYTGNPVITIGPRKRVISLELTRITNDQVKTLEKRFESVIDTKTFLVDSVLIHAWDDETAVQRLKIIKEVLDDTTVPAGNGDEDKSAAAESTDASLHPAGD
jgi:hypothetical protein